MTQNKTRHGLRWTVESILVMGCPWIFLGIIFYWASSDPMSLILLLVIAGIVGGFITYMLKDMGKEEIQSSGSDPQ